ncbi:MAG: hypothetical protein WB869_01200 [Candidatus Acidiferrales bacterium]
MPKRLLARDSHDPGRRDRSRWKRANGRRSTLASPRASRAAVAGDDECAGTGVTLALYSELVLVAALLVLWYWKENALYFVFVAAYIQNFLLAYLYTNRIAGMNFCRAAILFKEFLLLGLFLYALVLASREYQWEWPRPMLILFLFTGYCVLRYMFGALFLGDLSLDGLRKLRMMCYPVQILTVSVVFTWLRPDFSKRFLRHMIVFLAVLAVVAIGLFFFARVDFWKEHANIATYNMDVKGDDPVTVLEDQGVSGTAAGREAFLFLSSFRAMGTFADPLALGFAMAMPVLLLAYFYRKNWLNYLMLVLSGIALFCTFSRSSWIFVVLAVGYILVRRRKYVLIAGLALVVTVATIVITPLAEFANSETSELTSSRPGGAHAEGLIWFYQRAFIDPGNLLGKGTGDDVQKIPENGYAFLLEHFGFAAYASFLWFCFSLFAYFRSKENYLNPLLLIAQAVPVCILIVMHTSQYPFAFSEYLMIWFVVGTCLGLTLTGRPASHERSELPA